MSRGSFSFKLPEEQEEFQIHCQAMDMHSALWEIVHGNLRSMCKHGIEPAILEQLNNRPSKDEVAQATAEYIRDHIFQILNENGIDL